MKALGFIFGYLTDRSGLNGGDAMWPVYFEKEKVSWVQVGMGRCRVVLF